MDLFYDKRLLPAEELSKALNDSLFSFIHNAPIQDDITDFIMGIE